MANRNAERAAQSRAADQNNDQGGGEEELRNSPMMAHLLDALQEGTDIGHYGRLTFAMIARHFLDEKELLNLLSKQPDMDEREAHNLLVQVEGRDYNPPKRERILEWQSQQDFPICPTPDDPGACNVYRELRFPQDVYDSIGEFWEEKAQEENA
jgi:hypothetical protein